MHEEPNKYRVYWNMAKDGVPALEGATIAVTMKEKLSDYCVIDLPDLPTDAEALAALSYDIEWTDDVPTDGYNKDEYKTAKLVLKRIDAGEFIMGEDQTSESALANHKVTLTQPFYMALFETTQSQWKLVTGENPSQFSTDGEKKPVEMVSYMDIRGSVNGANWPKSNAVDDGSFLGLLRARTGKDFDLPTEAQWEYACRARTTTAYNLGGDTEEYLANAGWYMANSEYTTHDVGGKTANAWGLYDMHGNVSELCLDWFSYTLPYGLNPKGAEMSSERVLRGGDYITISLGCTSTFSQPIPYYVRGPYFGFRLALTVEQEQKLSNTKEFANVTTSVIADDATVNKAIEFNYLGEEGAHISISALTDGKQVKRIEWDEGAVGAESWQPSKPGAYECVYSVGGATVLSATYDMTDIPMSFSKETLASFNTTNVYDGAEHGIALTNRCAALAEIDNAEVAYTIWEADAAGDLYTLNYPTFKDAGTETVWYRIIAPGYAPYRDSATVTIKPRPVTLQSDTKTDFVYDGTAHEFPVLVKSEIPGEWFVAGEGVTTSNWATVKNVAEEEVENKFDYTFNPGTLAKNYDITVEYGKIAVQPASIIPGGGGESGTEPGDDEVPPDGLSKFDAAPVVYDGEGHTIDTNALVTAFKAIIGESGTVFEYYGYEADGAAAEDPLDFAEWRELAPVFINAGEYIVLYRVTNPNYTTFIHAAKVTIEKRPVTLQSGTKTDFVYDGKAHEFPVLVKSEIPGEWFVAGEGVTTSDWAKVTNVAEEEVENTFAYTFNSGTLAKNYDITVEYGTIAVQPLNISGGEVGDWVYELDEQHTYDGTDWTQKVKSATFKELPVTFDLTDNVQKNAGSYKLTLTGNGNFTGLRQIAWSIAPKQLVLTAADGTKVYDGTPLKADGVTAVGFEDGEGATYVLNKAQTNFGESKNVISDINWNEGTLESNYNVTTNAGTLKVTKRKVKITSGTNLELVYNGEAQTFEEITIEAVEADGVGFVAGEGIVTSNWATVTTVDDDVKANKFDYEAAAGTDLENYEITVVNGTIKVVPKTLTADMFSLVGVPDGGYVWDGTAKEPTVKVSDEESAIIDDSDFTVVYSNNIDVSTATTAATVTITGQNNYTGEVKLTFEIAELYADVTFDALGGKIGTENAVVKQQKHREYDNLPADPTRENYKFEGWYLDVADDNTEATAGDAWLADGEHTLYAKWEVDSSVLPGEASEVFTCTTNLNGTVTITSLKDITLAGGALVIPDMIGGKYVTAIAAGAFANSTKGITSVTLPMFLETIGRRAFSGIQTLTSVTFPSVRKWNDPSEAGTLTIDPYAFTSTALTSVRLPKEVKMVGDYAFADCRSLTEVTILGEPEVGKRPFRRAGIDAGSRPTVRLNETLANNTEYLAKITQDVNDVKVDTSAVVESVSLGSLTVAPGAVRLSVAVGRASDWGEVDTSRLRVEYRESLGDAPTTLYPSAVTPQADGTLAVEVAAPEGASGFFRVKVEE